MKIDIRRYLTLRDSLVKEKSQLETRLREINEALGESQAFIAATPAPSLSAAPAPATRRRRGRGRRGGPSLREAVLEATAGGPLTKEEILRRVEDMGYRFSTKNPLNSLGVILYGRNPRFKNEDGRFSPMGNVAVGAAKRSESTQPAKRGRKRRKLSPEARERIAAAQRARWARTKGK